MDVAKRLAHDPQVLAYFATLGVSMAVCFRRCERAWQVGASLLSVAVTWVLILRWTVKYKEEGGMNLFDDAYVDVMQGAHAGMSSQLLTWVVVATVWMHEASPFYMLFGMLGAMSAAFITWVPNRPIVSKQVSFLFVPCSLVSLVAIHLLPQTIMNPQSFGFWLKLLHVLLVIPQIVACVFPTLLKVNAAALYALLAASIAALHSLDPLLTMPYIMPTTDCQMSICCDLILCSLVTVYAVFVDTNSATQAAAALALMPFVPPGVILAMHLCRQSLIDEDNKLGFHSQVVTWMQDSVARSFTKKEGSDTTERGWMNLGLWRESDPICYTKACESLANNLGMHVFKSGDGVLACGCGYGAELLFWKSKFNLAHITGIDPNPKASRTFRPNCNVRLLPIQVSDMVGVFENQVEFNRVVALDSIYHFNDKLKFFKDCKTLLPSSGTVGVTDLLLNIPLGKLPYWVKLILQCMNVNVSDLWTKQEYEAKLGIIGFIDTTVRTYDSASVLSGWFPSFMLKYVEYAVITANVPVQPVAFRKQKVAVIGSGLSGLVAAHSLAGACDVTVFEAEPSGGLSGKGELVHGEVVDIPLRIIGQGYYETVEALARRLHVRLEPIREDHLSQTHYSQTRKTFAYTHSYWSNFLSLLPYVFELVDFNRNFYSGGESVSRDETWGQWMSRHGYVTSVYASKECRQKTSEDEAKQKHDSYLMWLFMGQASWMLSCTYQQVLDYPASILLNFFRRLGVGKNVTDAILSSGSQSGKMMRIKPSMQALEFALRYGIKVRYNTRVHGVTKDRVIDGVKYDAVVLATEASAIKNILSEEIYNEVFSEVKYQPSSIYLHSDASLLPPCRSQWKAFNICQDEEHDMCMLTAWLNMYYTESKLGDKDLFQTWNPHTPPADEDIVKVVHFLRVVHTSETPRILKVIEEEQGVNGFYYAGAYSVGGMGLLEQAAQSGVKVAERIKRDIL